MPGISIHVVDVSRGVVAAGMRVEVIHDGARIAAGETSSQGLLEIEGMAQKGMYEAIFHVAGWYRAQQVALPSPPFRSARMRATPSCR